MKTLTSTIALLLLASISIAQDYTPFNQSTSKRFFDAGNPSDNDYFYHMDSSAVSGDTTLISQYYSLKYTPTDDCSFWGGPIGVELDTTWLGQLLKWNSVTKELLVKNDTLETLNFDFNLPLGSTAPFYSNATVEYRIEHTANVFETFYGISDSIQIFEIQAFDNLGSPIASTLNNFEIKLSKNHGLLSFINCYRFPFIEQGMELQGQTNPTIGNYQLTYDDCYPWVIGDVVQYSTYNSGGNSSPFCHVYQKITVTDRIETADSVKIYVSAETYITTPLSPFSPYFVYNTLIFKKGTQISELPWNKNRTHPYFTPASEAPANWCGSVPSLHWGEQFEFYCESCRCYGGYDGNGQSVSSIQYAHGLGVFKKSSHDYGYPTNAGGKSAQMIYSNVNGVECGTLWSDIDELNTINISLAPNPTSDHVKISSSLPIEEIRMVDFYGRTVYSSPKMNSITAEIDLSSYQKGAYFLEISINGTIHKRTIIRE